MAAFLTGLTVYNQLEMNQLRFKQAIVANSIVIVGHWSHPDGVKLLRQSGALDRPGARPSRASTAQQEF
jgi:hypothetical protein